MTSPLNTTNTWAFVQEQSPALYTQVFAAPHERGAVLLTHGYAEHLGRYTGFIQQLNHAGFTVYAYDQRGHGRSGGARAVVDLRLLVEDHLRARESLRALAVPLFAFGHSAGGLVTAASALRDPRGLSGVILSSPALLVGQNESALLKKLSGLLGRLTPALGVTELPTSGISRLPEEVERYKADTQNYHGKVPALTAASMLSLSEELGGQWDKWRLPTLVIHGSADRLADVQGSRRFAAQAGLAYSPRPAITYHEVEGGYHELLHDLDAPQTTRLVLDWLRARLAAV